MTPTFSQLASAYPTEDKAALFAALGGEWPGLANDPDYNNTCAVRMSVALRKAGMTIDKQYQQAMDNDGNPLVLNVSVMNQLITELFGDFSWGMSKKEGADIQQDIPKKSGIIVYHVAWDNATGHFDLWDGSSFVGNGRFEDIEDGYDIRLWYLS